jgi:pimeloyl-ACP methyl ester carboxylesterase
MTSLTSLTNLTRLTSRSDFLRIRGLRYHVRRWGREDAPMVFLGHGWLDVSATFQPMVEPLLERWQVLAPDWRGFGHTQWPQDGYWFPDYLADFEAIALHYSPTAPLRLVGHSMGAQIFSLYAGLRPARVAQLACLDGLFLPDMPAPGSPRRIVRWFEQMAELPAGEKFYDSFEILAARVRKQHPRLSPEQALFIARCWGEEDGRGRIRLLADPKHRLNGPLSYRVADSKATWQQVSAACLFVEAGKSQLRSTISAEERAQRLGCFRDRRERVLAEAGHMLHFDAPLETARLVAEFLAESA